MPKRDWLGNLTLALVALATLVFMVAICMAIIFSEYAKVHHANAAYQQNAERERRTTQEEIAESCYSADRTRFRDCVANKLETYYREQSTNEDLQAQQDMAFWAAAIFFLGIIQAFIGLAGIYYVARNLTQTAQSVQLANKAIVVENRPWVQLDVPRCTEINVTKRHAQIGLNVELMNVGGSPAQRVHVEAFAIYPGSRDPIADIKDWIRKRTTIYSREMWERSVFVNTTASWFIPAFVPGDFIQRQIAESGIDFFSPQFAVAAFYTTNLDDDVYTTTHLIEIARIVDGRPKAIPGAVGKIPADELSTMNVNGLVIAT